jgi:hypothetical protein
VRVAHWLFKSRCERKIRISICSMKSGVDEFIYGTGLIIALYTTVFAYDCLCVLLFVSKCFDRV